MASEGILTGGLGAEGQILADPSSMVWRDLTQETLDRAYDQTVWAPNMEALRAARSEASRMFLSRFGDPQVLAFGTGPWEAIDLYKSPSARTPQAPTLIFIHGGAWRQIPARDYACLAEAYVTAGYHVAMLDFAGVAESGGDLGVLVEQVRRGLTHLVRAAPELGLDASAFTLLGYSSGAHLAGVLLAADWTSLTGTPACPVRNAMLISGMYGLEPVALSKRSTYVAFTEALVAQLSPIRHLAHWAAPVTLAVGTAESPEFIRQTNDMARALDAAGHALEMIVVDGANHFEMLAQVMDPHTQLAQALRAKLTM